MWLWGLAEYYTPSPIPASRPRAPAYTKSHTSAERHNHPPGPWPGFAPRFRKPSRRLCRKGESPLTLDNPLTRLTCDLPEEEQSTCVFPVSEVFFSCQFEGLSGAKWAKTGMAPRFPGCQDAMMFNCLRFAFMPRQ